MNTFLNWRQILFFLTISWLKMEPSKSIVNFVDHDGKESRFLSDTTDKYYLDSAATTEYYGTIDPLLDPMYESQKGMDQQLLGFSPDVLHFAFNLSENINASLLDSESTSNDSDHRWQIRRQREKEHCYVLALEEVSNPPYERFCPRVWDRLLCWPPALPGSVTSLPCILVPEFKGVGNATRICDTNGTWAGNSTPESLVPGWSNYSACINHNHDPHPLFPQLIFDWLPMIKTMSIVGYSVSLVTLIFSFGILASLRRLRCPRNILHLHLFASFMLRASVVLFKSTLNLEESLPPNLLHLQTEMDSDSSPGSWQCQLLIAIWQYFILANYSWILMEGLYLHNLIFMALFSDSSAITLYIVLGWGLPLVCVSTWAGLRAGLDNVHCWTVNKVEWIFWLSIRIPVALSNLLNFFFFLNVMRVLLLKLRSSITPESMKYRKLGKSTLVLVPLFGVHYFLLWGLSVSANVTVELAWLILDQVFASFQGFFVAVLYCLMNGEVRQELRKLHNRFKGEGVPELSYSTAISHTRSYFSRGRASIHSIHSTTDKRDNRQTPSPQMPRAVDYLSPSPRALSPTSGKLPEFYSINSSQPKLNDLLNNKLSSETESIELQTTSLMPISSNAGSSFHPRKETDPILWEETVPFISEKDKIRIEIQRKLSNPPEEGANHLSLGYPSNTSSSSDEMIVTGEKSSIDGLNNFEANGVVGRTKDILVKVNVHNLSNSAQCSLLENESQQGESML